MTRTASKRQNSIGNCPAKKPRDFREFRVIAMTQFYIFFIDKSMFSLRICGYSMGKLMVEVLNTVKKCTIY